MIIGWVSWVRAVRLRGSEELGALPALPEKRCSLETKGIGPPPCDQLTTRTQKRSE